MQKIFLLVMMAIAPILALAQTADQLIKEGIALHDKGEYEAAIAKYEEVLKDQPDHVLALYEKAYSLTGLEKYEEAAVLCKRAVEIEPKGESARHCYVIWGTALDKINKPEESIKVYDKGLKAFPDFYLLHFNKAITQMGIKKEEEALASLQLSLSHNPMHGSSHYYSGMLMQNKNKVPALLSYLSFIAMEPMSKRSAYAAGVINDMIYGHIKKDGNNTTINISSDWLDTKKMKEKEDDFTTTELLFSLLGAVDDSKEIDSIAKTPAEKMDLKLQTLISSLAEGKKKGKGFYWKFYVPFFVEMKEKGHVAVLAHLYILASGKEEEKEWFGENEKATDDFFAWLKAYKWSRK